MQQSSRDVGCGTYGAFVLGPQKPPEPLQLQARQCYTSDQFGSHLDVKDGEINSGADWFCNTHVGAGDQLGATDAAIDFDLAPDGGGGGSPFDDSNVYPIGNLNSYLRFTVSWVNGCVTTVDKQNVRTPLDKTQCKDLMYGNWQSCEWLFFTGISSHMVLILCFLPSTGNNGGTGGWIQAGCLKYDFKPYALQ
jgi:hypothetical protein